MDKEVQAQLISESTNQGKYPVASFFITIKKVKMFEANFNGSLNRILIDFLS